VPEIVGWRTADSTDVIWYERMRLFEVEALQRVRESAQRWASVLAAITGVFGVATLVKGPSDLTKIADERWANVAAYAVVAALLLVATATICANVAQGVPTRAPIDDVERFRAKFSREIRDSDSWLLWSRITAVAAVLLVAAAVTITWIGTPRALAFETVGVVVRDVDGVTHCGKVIFSSSSWIALKTADDRVEFLPTTTTSLKHVDANSSCGSGTPTAAPSPSR
jgi:hypothetical protein